MQENISMPSRVFAHISIFLSDGSVADSTKTTGKPSVIHIGTGSVSSAMEQQLISIPVGETRKFTLQASDAFGDVEPNLIHFMDLHQFPADVKLEEGTVMAFDQPNGSQLPGIIREVQGHSVKVDFNHPLAGQAVTFEVELLSFDNPPES